VRRVSEHREDMIPGLTSRYGLKTLVWYEAFDFDAAAHRGGWQTAAAVSAPAVNLGPRFREDERERGA